MTDTEKELLECLKDYIKQTETAHVQEGIWFNKVYKDAKELVKKLTIANVVGQSEQLVCEHPNRFVFRKHFYKDGNLVKKEKLKFSD